MSVSAVGDTIHSCIFIFADVFLADVGGKNHGEGLWSYLLLLAALIAESADACTVPNGSELANQTTAGRMTVRTGKPCGVRLIFSRGPTHGVEIVQRPRNGTATVVPPHPIVYRSR
jgi:hypothetical protein